MDTTEPLIDWTKVAVTIVLIVSLLMLAMGVAMTHVASQQMRDIEEKERQLRMEKWEYEYRRETDEIIDRAKRMMEK